MPRNPIPGSDDIARAVLPNGVVVLVRENFDAQSVVVSGSFIAGAAFEAPEKGGLAAMAARAVDRGTHTRDFYALHETLESAGMSMGVDGGRLLSSFEGKALGEDLPILLELLGDVLRNPSFPEDQVELLKAEAITGLRYSQQDTRYRAGKAFRQLAYPTNHVYYRGTGGEIETVSALTPDDLRAYHGAQFGPAGMIIVIVGAVKAADALALVEKFFGDWHNPTQQTDISQPPVPKPDGIKTELIALPGKSQSDILLGVPGPNRKAPDYQAAAMVNNVLGVFGMFGRLGKSVREEQGLAYYCYSGLDGGLEPGPWRVSAGVNPAHVKQAVDSIRRELERIIEQPVTEDELSDNKANLIGKLPLRLESNEGVAGNILNMERYGLGLDYLRTYADLINSLTIQELHAAMRHYWSPDKFILTVAGPELQESIV